MIQTWLMSYHIETTLKQHTIYRGSPSINYCRNQHIVNIYHNTFFMLRQAGRCVCPPHKHIRKPGQFEKWLLVTIRMIHLYYYRWGAPGWHSTGSHSHLSTWAGSGLLLSGSSGDHLQCRLPPVQLCVQKQKVMSASLQIGINCHYQILNHACY